MPHPFPRMDPWLEQPGIWDDLHTRLITMLGNELGPRLRPRYRVAVEQRAYLVTLQPRDLVGRPEISVVRTAEPAPAWDTAVAAAPVAPVLPVQVEFMYDEVVERYLEIRKPVSGEVVTVIEILSSKNKRPGEGRAMYEQKRFKVVHSLTNLVEIDLLRGRKPMYFVGPPGSAATDYRILVSRGINRLRATLYPFNLRDPIPRVPIPLLPGDEELEIDLGVMIQEIYDLAGYDLTLDYAAPPTPPLGKEDATWAGEQVRMVEKNLFASP